MPQLGDSIRARPRSTAVHEPICDEQRSGRRAEQQRCIRLGDSDVGSELRCSISAACLPAARVC
eukprot:5457602-Prymnesium_polylepis.1